MHTRHRLLCFLAALLVVVTPPALRAVDVEPFTLPVTFSFRISGVGNGIMTVYGEGSSPSVGHTTYNATTESGPQYVKLCPGKAYTLNFQASGPSDYALNLTPPSGYQFFVNGQPKDLVYSNPGGGWYSHDYSIELRPAHGESVVDSGIFTGIDLGQAVSWELGMGASRGGHSIGRAGFRQRDLTNSPASRAHLYYTPPINSTQVNVIRDGSSNQVIRQIASPHKVMDFVDVTNGYEVRYYDFDDTTWTGSVYTINSGKTPWKGIFVEAPSGTSNQLRITETEGSVSRISHLSLTSGSVSSGTYVWQLQEGGPSSNWLRTTTHSSTLSGSVRENVVTVRAGGTSGTIISETKYVYHTYAWGEDLYQVIANPNGASGAVLTTTYTYHETAPTSGNETYMGNYARVKAVTDPTGGWTAYAYYDAWDKRGQIQYQYQPYQDSPSSVTLDTNQGRVKYYDYAPDPTGRYRRPSLVQETVREGGTTLVTAKSVWTYDNSSNSGLARVKADVDTYASTSVYQRTRTEIIDPLTADVNESGEPYLVKNPDLSQVSWSRSAGDYAYSPTFAFTVNASTGQHWRILKVNGSSSSAGGAQSQSSYDGQSFEPVHLIPYKSTMEVTILRFTGKPLRSETRIYLDGGTWSAAVNTVDSTYNTHGRLTEQVAQNGATTSYTYTNGLMTSQTGADGVQTDFTYDALWRTETVKKVGVSASGIHYAQADITTTYDYDEVDGTNYATKETVSASGETSIVTSRSYDRAGRVIKVTPPGLSATTMVYDSTARTSTTTAPDGGNTIRETYRDGSLKSITGTATVPQYYAYAVESDGRQRVQVNSGTSGSTRLQKTWTDWRGRPIKLEKPGFSQTSQSAYVEEQFYDATTGQQIKTTRTGANPTLYVYDTLGSMVRSGLDVDNGSASATTASAVAAALVTASNDRITETDVSFNEPSTNIWWLVSTSTTYPDAGAATHPIVTSTRQRLSGFPANRLSDTEATDAEGNLTISLVDISGKLITTRTSVPGLTTDRYSYVYNGLASAATGHDGLTTKAQYDALGRPWKSIDARGLTTTTAYYAGTALPSTVTDSASNVVNTVGYTTAGRVDWSQDAMTRKTRYAYNQRGQVTQHWGDGTYPVAYGYDATYGDRTSMSTYRSAPTADSTSWPSVGAADTTTWNYDTPSGLLWKKTDAAWKYVTMNYNQAGKTSTRTLARGVVTTYAYASATGEVTGQTYSDSTPSVTYTYNRLGQTDTVVDTTGTWDFVYDSAKPWRLAATGLPSFYGTRVQTMLYESGSGTMVGRYLGFQLGTTAADATDLEQRYAYSSDGRFDTLTSKRAGNTVSRTFDYSYLANTPFVSSLTVTGGHNFSVARTYESNRNLLASIDTKWSTTSVARYDFAHNALGQRTTAKQSGTAYADYYVSGSYSAVFNVYTYNARNELETSAMYRGDTPTPSPSSTDELPGRRFEYRFDSIGNRKTDGPTGDANNADDQYTVNALNQYTAKENNTVRFLGTAATGATVGLTGAIVTGKKDRAWGADLVPANISTAAAGTASVYSAVAGGGSGGGDLIKTTARDYFIPKGAQTFGYDDDGNLTHDSVFDYTYDAENRLIAMQHRNEVIGTLMITSSNARKLVFVYDYMGRRVRKTTYGGWNGTSYGSTALTDTKYLYDGWNLIAEFSSSDFQSFSLSRSHTWGLDLTGSLTASGGVGALLQTYDAVAGKTLLPAYDGNGNVAALLNAETGSTLTLEAAYEYDPFGNLLRNEGSYATLNNFRFSTKFTDTESGLVYYGHRYYAPWMGRFINRDPIEEEGGLNLYGFCGNDGVNHWDYLGMINNEIETGIPYGRSFDPSQTTVYGGSSNSDWNIASSYLNPKAADIARIAALTGGTYIGTDANGNLAFEFANFAAQTAGLAGLTSPSDQDRLVGYGLNNGLSGGDIGSYSNHYFQTPLGVTQYHMGGSAELSGSMASNIALGAGQGLLDSVNGAQDQVIGTANLLRFNSVPAGAGATVNPFEVAPPPITSPDWSKDVLVSSDIYPHDLNKVIGGTSLTILVGTRALPAGNVTPAGSLSNNAALVSTNVRAFLRGERTLQQLSAAERAQAALAFERAAANARNAAEAAFQQARAAAVRGQGPSPGTLSQWLKSFNQK